MTQKVNYNKLFMVGKSQNGSVSFFNPPPVYKGGAIQQLLKQMRFPSSKISSML